MPSGKKLSRNGRRTVGNELNIDLKWLECQTGSPVERAFYADIGLKAGGQWLTLLENLEAGTTSAQLSTHLRANAHLLATWFAANWWRLRWEPANPNWSKDADWRIAHSLASVGGGYVWPNIIFASDGDALTLVSRPRNTPAPYEPIRYLSQPDVRISAVEFECKLDAFMAGIISRLQAMNIKDDSLPELWSEIQVERGDPEATQWRKLEALCGYDPDEAPAALLKMLIKDDAHLGSHALEEVAAQSRHATREALRSILALANSTGEPRAGGFRVRMPKLQNAPTQQTSDRPWQWAAKLARKARREWNLGRQFITDGQLADLLESKPDVFIDQTKAPSPMPVALRSRDSDKVDFYINQLPSTSRRFATARLLGDQLGFANGGRLFPATTARTVRQQFQRAFAQEFLCPINALLEKIQAEEPDENDISEAADYFQVSQLMIRTTLVNHGYLERETLAWAD